MVANLVGGIVYGGVKAAKLVAVKALDRSRRGATSGMVAYINWVISDAAENGGCSVLVAGSQRGTPPQ